VQTARLQTLRKSLVRLVVKNCQKKLSIARPVAHNSTRETAGSNPSRYGETKNTQKIKLTSGMEGNWCLFSVRSFLFPSFGKLEKNKIRTFSGMDEKWQTKRTRKVTEHRQHVRHHFIGSAAKLYTLEKKQGDLRELPFANRVPRPFVFIHKNLFFTFEETKLVIGTQLEPRLLSAPTPRFGRENSENES
jgi:hypothetical protein